MHYKNNRIGLTDEQVFKYHRDKILKAMFVALLITAFVVIPFGIAFLLMVNKVFQMIGIIK
jgi:hypothetical protein